jgi:hypothetical protein
LGTLSELHFVIDKTSALRLARRTKQAGVKRVALYRLRYVPYEFFNFDPV